LGGRGLIKKKQRLTPATGQKEKMSRGGGKGGENSSKTKMRMQTKTKKTEIRGQSQKACQNPGMTAAKVEEPFVRYGGWRTPRKTHRGKSRGRKKVIFET